MNPDIKKKLEKKFGSVRTGGKGSVRRKNKNFKSKIVSTHMTKEEKTFIEQIEEINILILNLRDDDICLWNIYFDEWMFDVIMDMRKKDFSKNSKYDINSIRDNYEDFLYELITEEGDYQLFTQSYKFLKSNMSNSGLNYISNSFYSIKEIISNKEYIPSESAENVDNINDYLTILELPLDEIPTKLSLRKAYFQISSKVHPDKHPNESIKYTEIFSKVNNAYHILLKYYFNDK